MRVRTRGALGAIIRQEILYNVKRPAPWLLLALFSGNAALWTFAGPAQVRGWAINSDFYVARMCAGFAFLTAPFFVAVLMGDPIVRDYRLGVAPLLLSRPVSRAEYLTGKFLGNFLVLAACCAGFAVTMFLLQGAAGDGSIVLPWRLAPYLKHFSMLVVVPVLALAALCFTVGTLTRSVKLVYGLVASLYVLHGVAMTTLKGSTPFWSNLLDPVAFGAVNELGRGRRAAALNQLAISYTGVLLANRALTLALAALCLTILYLRFSRVERGAAPRDTGALVVLGLSEKAERLSREEAAASGQRASTGEGHPPARDELVRAHTVPLPLPAVTRGGPRTRLAQFAAAVGVEFRLLRSERSLIVLAPVAVFLCSAELESHGTAFGAPFFPLSSVYAANSVNALLIMVCGITIFYTGEVLHRDRELGVEPALWSTPVPDWLLLLSKFAAMFLLALGLVALVGLTALALQLFRGAASVELSPYLIIYTVILLPTIAFMVGAAIALNVLLRDKHLAHAAGVALGVGLFYLLGRGYINWLYNPVLYRLWAYSDMTGLGPYRTGLLLHRVYWLAITAACLALAHLFFRRDPSRRLLVGRRLTDFGGAALVLAAAAVAVIAAGLAIKREIDRGPDGGLLEAARIRYEERFAAAFADAPQPGWSGVDLQVELFPREQRLHARGRFRLLNRSREKIGAVLVSLDPAFDWQAVSIDGASRPPRTDESARVYALDAPLEPGGRTTLRAEWDATIPRGILRDSHAHSNFIYEGGTLLGGPSLTGWLPLVGYLREWEISETETRRRYGKPPQEPRPDLEGASFAPAGGGDFPLVPFDLRIEITVPEDETAVSAGRLVEVRGEGGRRRTFVYESEYPLNGFPVVSAPYAEKRRGPLAVYYHPRHAFNVDALLDAMEAARRKYERDYGPLPYRELRFAEFPRLADFAISYPSAIPCSEAIVFLTRAEAGHVDANYFAAAHEVAHQWFGGGVVAGGGRGGGVLLEGLAEYAAGALIEEELGERAAGVFRRFEEAAYLRGRQADKELPLTRVDGSHPSHGVIFYQKAGLVFHMLEGVLGREKMNAALKEYVARFGWREARPTIHDLVAIFRRQTPDGSLDWFYEQWFDRVTVPDFQITSATVRQEGDEYLVEFSADNLGEGEMTVTVAAVAGGESGGEDVRAASVGVVVRRGEATKGVIRSAFRPGKLVLDPGVEIIDADRGNNEFNF